MAKKQVIRIGDKVEVINAKWIRRIGYNLVWTDLFEEVENDPRTFEAMRAIGMWGGQTCLESVPDKVPFDLVRVIAMHRVRERDFGGRERKIHYYEMVESHSQWAASDTELPMHSYHYMPGFISEVVGKRIAKTGTYFSPSSGGYDSWNGDYYDGDPGGLGDCKTHIILKLQNGLEIEACDVKPYEKQ